MLEERNAISETPLSASKKLGIIEKHKEARGGQKDNWLIKVALFAARSSGRPFRSSSAWMGHSWLKASDRGTLPTSAPSSLVQERHA